MTNFEKYSKDLVSTNFAVVKGTIVFCDGTPCSVCDLLKEKDTCTGCDVSRIKWLKAEYEEPKINIPESTPVDTKVLVSMNGTKWIKRYYAGFKDGEYYAWNDGRTSFTIVDAEYSKRQKSNKRPWEYMKLYNEEEE